MENIDSIFLDFAKNGDVCSMLAALCKGANINARSPNLFTASIWAAANGNAECLSELIKRGADVNLTADGQRAATQAVAGSYASATSASYVSCLRLILEANKAAAVDLNVDEQDEDGEADILLAARAGNVQCLKLLLEHGADVDLRNSKGLTPTMCSAQNGHTHCLQFLLGRSPDVNAKDAGGNTALILAARYEKLESVALLLDRELNVDLGIENNDGMSAVKWLDKYDHTDWAARIRAEIERFDIDAASSDAKQNQKSDEASSSGMQEQVGVLVEEQPGRAPRL